MFYDCRYTCAARLSLKFSLLKCYSVFKTKKRRISEDLNVRNAVTTRNDTYGMVLSNKLCGVIALNTCYYVSTPLLYTTDLVSRQCGPSFILDPISVSSTLAYRNPRRLSEGKGL